jgi:hypothetical protein
MQNDAGDAQPIFKGIIYQISIMSVTSSSNLQPRETNDKDEVSDSKTYIENSGINQSSNLLNEDDSDEEKSFVCSICEAKLSCAASLARHMRTAKYCLNLRAEPCGKIWKCEFCEYKTGVSHNFQRHLKSCSTKYKKNMTKEVNKLRQDIERETEIKMLREQLEDLKKEAYKPRITNIQNNLIQLQYSQQILSPYDSLQEKFGEILKTHYQMPQYKKGVEGVSTVINDHILGHNGKRWLISYKPSEYTFHRKRDTEAIEIDEKAELLLDDLMPIISGLTKKYFDEAIDDALDYNQKVKICDSNKAILNIAKKGSTERRTCVQSIAERNAMDSDLIPY